MTRALKAATERYASINPEFAEVMQEFRRRDDPAAKWLTEAHGAEDWSYGHFLTTGEARP
jgi:hypothetical protein